jgi:hypothetical protein
MNETLRSTSSALEVGKRAFIVLCKEGDELGRICQAETIPSNDGALSPGAKTFLGT